MNLSFDEAAHAYTLDGERVPSVTQVLDGCGMTPDYSLVDPYYRLRGSAVHAAVALELTGRLDWSSLDEHTRPYVKRAVRVAELLGLQAIAVETAWADPVYRYAGTFDVFSDSKIGPLLLDWKAGQFEPSHLLQTAGGYWPLMELAAQAGAIPVDIDMARKCRVAVVPLTSDLPKPVWVENKVAQRNVFRAALSVYHWRRQHNIRRAA